MVQLADKGAVEVSSETRRSSATRMETPVGALSLHASTEATKRMDIEHLHKLETLHLYIPLAGGSMDGTVRC